MTVRTANETARLLAAGYQPPMSRASCARCAFGTMYLTKAAGAKRVRKDVYCTKHRTGVACGGWCKAHSPVAIVERQAA